jgi:hypothetical protein
VKERRKKPWLAGKREEKGRGLQDMLVVLVEGAIVLEKRLREMVR